MHRMLYNPEWEKPTFTNGNGIENVVCWIFYRKESSKKEKQVNKENK